MRFRRVVDQYVRNTMRGGDFVGVGLHRGGACYVELVGVRRPTLVADRRRGLLSRREVDVGDADRRAEACERQCRFAADTAAGSGDDHQAAIEGCVLPPPGTRRNVHIYCPSK